MWMYYLGEICWWVRLFSWILLFWNLLAFFVACFLTEEKWKEHSIKRYDKLKAFKKKYPECNDETLKILRRASFLGMSIRIIVAIAILIFVPPKDKIEEIRSQQEIQLLKKD